jgi:hypothetical protein
LEKSKQTGKTAMVRIQLGAFLLLAIDLIAITVTAQTTASPL